MTLLGTQTFVELGDFLDKDNYARELLHSIVPRLHSIGHLDREDFLLVEIVVNGLKRSEAVLRRLISWVIWQSGILVIKTGFWGILQKHTEDKRMQLAKGGGRQKHSKGIIQGRGVRG